jgi:hypothetical protein
MLKTKFYAPPLLRSLPIKIEKGFAQSEENDDLNYENGGNAW